MAFTDDTQSYILKVMNCTHNLPMMAMTTVSRMGVLRPCVSCSQRTGGRRDHAMACSAQGRSTTEDQNSILLGRRGAILGAGVLSVAQLMTVPMPARALIPDDDDEDMIEKAKANRKKRLAGERQAEKEFSRSEGFVDKNAKQNLVVVQLAVNALAKVGGSLAQGSVEEANAAVGEVNINKLGGAIKSLSLNGESQGAGETVVSELSSLASALGSGSLSGAKKEYVDTVIALTDWTVKANVSGLKGI